MHTRTHTHTFFSRQRFALAHMMSHTYVFSHIYTHLCCNLSVSPCEDRRASGSTEVPNGSSVAPAVNAWSD